MTYLFFYILGYVAAIATIFILAIILKLKIYDENYKKEWGLNGKKEKRVAKKV